MIFKGGIFMLCRSFPCLGTHFLISPNRTRIGLTPTPANPRRQPIRRRQVGQLLRADPHLSPPPHQRERHIQHVPPPPRAPRRPARGRGPLPLQLHPVRLPHVPDVGRGHARDRSRARAEDYAQRGGTEHHIVGQRRDVQEVGGYMGEGGPVQVHASQ